MKVIIAGGRDYRFTRGDSDKLDLMHALVGFTEVVSGGASGADACGEAWAAKHGIEVKQFRADWDTHGRAAGPIRNKQMAEYVGPFGRCILFPGGRGTESMKREAETVGVTVYDWRGCSSTEAAHDNLRG